jgi:hypothetical protein
MIVARPNPGSLATSTHPFLDLLHMAQVGLFIGIGHSSPDASQGCAEMLSPQTRPNAEKSLVLRRPSIWCFAVAVAFSAVSSAAIAATGAQKLSVPRHVKQSMVIEGVNVSVGDFLDAYLGADIERQLLAEAFLIGVLDATERRGWCSYSTIKTVTIVEHLIPELKKLAGSQMDDRAAPVIEAQLKRIFPCKDAR